MKILLTRRGPWLAALLVACAQARILGLREAAWVGDQLWGQETIGVAQVLALPLVAAATALAGWEDRAGLLTLFPRGRPRQQHVLQAQASWAVVFAVPYLVANVVVLTVSARASIALTNGSAWPIITQLLGMLVAVTMGYAIGFVIRSWASAIVAAATFALWVLLDRMGAISSGLAEYASSGSLVGATPDPTYFATRAAWLLALVVIAALATTVSNKGLQAGAAATIGVLLIGSFAFPNNTSYQVAAHPDEHCSTTPTVVCGPVEFSRRIDEGGQAATRASNVLKAVGVIAHPRFELWTPRTDSMDSLLLVNPSRFRDRLSLYEVANGVATPKSCAMWRLSTPPSEELFAAQRLLTEYVLAHMTDEGNGTSYDRLANSVGTVSANEALTAAGQAFQRCSSTLPPHLDSLPGKP